MMGLSFLAPFLLAGTALISIPWLLHHIRRPEREPVPFSSLLFVPAVKKEVIERRRIQHLLLLLLRMLLIFILFYAFSRPFYSTTVKAEVDDQSTIQLILVDTSYSMRMDDHFSKAKQEAIDIINALSSNDYVAVVPFHRNPTLNINLEIEKQSPSKSQETALLQVKALEPTYDTTRFIPALQDAERFLLNIVQDMEDNQPQLIIHMISDFQREGLPTDSVGWKLSSKIDLKLVHLQEEYEEPDNISILETNVRDQQDTYRITGKIKNWTNEDRDVDVDLWLSGELVDTRNVFIQSGNATQIFFTVPKVQGQTVWGWMETADDSLEVDNKRYVVRNPKMKLPVEIITSKNDQTTSSAWFVYQALTHSKNLPWAVTALPHENVEWREGSQAKPVYIIPDWVDDSGGFITQFLSQIDHGISALMLLDDSVELSQINSVLVPLGLESLGLNHEQFNARQYSLLNKIDFEHSIFAVFQGQKFNDFSPIRFYRYHKLSENSTNKTDLTIKYPAIFESGDDGNPYPAIVEVLAGKSRLIIVPYGYQLDWSNIPKSKKFVPLLHEMLYYLQDEDDIQESWIVGDENEIPVTFKNSGEVVIDNLLDDGNEVIAFQNQNKAFYVEPGLLELKTSTQTNTESMMYAINIDSAETNLEPIPNDEFLLRYCAAPNLNEEELDENQVVLADEEVVQQHEYGIVLIVAMFGMVMFEMWYSTKLT
jgi:hypothetical protein